MEIIKTEITIETHDPKKGYTKVDQMIKDGFEHVSTEAKIPQLDEARYVFKLTKLEQFGDIKH